MPKATVSGRIHYIEAMVHIQSQTHTQRTRYLPKQQYYITHPSPSCTSKRKAKWKAQTSPARSICRQFRKLNYLRIKQERVIPVSKLSKGFLKMFGIVLRLKVKIL